MSKYSFLLLLILLSSSLFSQDKEFSSGLIMDDGDYEMQPREARFPGSKYNNLPLKVDLKQYCPEVGHQGGIESCVGWSVGYGALTIERAIQNGWTDKSKITENANSALFIYNQVKEDQNCGSGSKISAAVQLIIKEGDCLSHSFDGDANNCEKQPDNTRRTEANNYIVSDYLTLFSPADEPALKLSLIHI